MWQFLCCACKSIFMGRERETITDFIFCSCSMFCHHPPWIKCSSRTWDIHVFIVQRAKPRPCASEGQATAALCTRAANEGMPTRCGRFAVLTRSCCPATAGDLHWGGIAASIMWVKWPWFIQDLSSKNIVGISCQATDALCTHTRCEWRNDNAAPLWSACRPDAQLLLPRCGRFALAIAIITLQTLLQCQRALRWDCCKHCCVSKWPWLGSS